MEDILSEGMKYRLIHEQNGEETKDSSWNLVRILEKKKAAVVLSRRTHKTSYICDQGHKMIALMHNRKGVRKCCFGTIYCD